jgi:uncharacterized iron-regulated protein
MLLAGAAGCKKDHVVEPGATLDLGPVLTHTTTTVIVGTYERLDTTSGSLVVAVMDLQASPTAGALTAARNAWRTARVPWENSEAFLYGPVETEGIDPSIDSWPVNEVDLQAVLVGSAALTKEYIDGLEGTLKGFHTIEYLLFGTTGTKQVTDFTAREFQYLVAVAQSLRGETARLAHAWRPGGQNFAGNLINAGSAGSIYASKKAALQEVVNGMLTIADEVANGKINDPFVQRDVTLEESRFSANSKADFQDNIRGILYMYTGAYDGRTGASVSDVVKAHDGALDVQFRAAVQTAIEKIGAIPGTFTTAIFSNPTSVQDAQSSVRAVQQMLESSILPLVSTKVQ